MKTIIIPASVLLSIALVGCDDTSASYPPTYKGFSYEPKTVHPGDSVVITAVQAKRGHYLNATDYSFSLTLTIEANGETQDSTLSYSRHTNYDGTDNGDPSWALHLPADTRPGSYTCTFRARWSNSANGEMGTYLSTGGEGCVGSITSHSYTLYSDASGTFTLPIAQ